MMPEGQTSEEDNVATPTHGVGGIEYELEDVDVEAIMPPEFSTSPALPDHREAEIRRYIVEFTARGADPDRLGRVYGYDWRADPAFAKIVERSEEACIARVEVKVWETIANGGKIPTGIQFWLKARAGYDDRRGDDGEGLPQNITIKQTVVRGDTKEDDAA